MPLWLSARGDYVFWKNTRSPGLQLDRATGAAAVVLPEHAAADCLPTWRAMYHTKPEQSKPLGLAPPQTYGGPSSLRPRRRASPVAGRAAHGGRGDGRPGGPIGRSRWRGGAGRLAVSRAAASRRAVLPPAGSSRRRGLAALGGARRADGAAARPLRGGRAGCCGGAPVVARRRSRRATACRRADRDAAPPARRESAQGRQIWLKSISDPRSTFSACGDVAQRLAAAGRRASGRAPGLSARRRSTAYSDLPARWPG